MTKTKGLSLSGTLTQTGCIKWVRLYCLRLLPLTKGRWIATLRLHHSALRPRPPRHPWPAHAQPHNKVFATKPQSTSRRSAAAPCSPPCIPPLDPTPRPGPARPQPASTDSVPPTRATSLLLALLRRSPDCDDACELVEGSRGGAGCVRVLTETWSPRGTLPMIGGF